MPDQVDSAKVLTEFAAGATIVLQGLHRLWPPLTDFVRGLTDDLGHAVNRIDGLVPNFKLLLQNNKIVAVRVDCVK